MAVIVFGGGSRTSAVESCSVLVTKPTENAQLRVFCTAVEGGKLCYASRPIAETDVEKAFSVAKGSAFVVVKQQGNRLGFDTEGDLELDRAYNDELQLWAFDVRGDGEIIFTE